MSKAARFSDLLPLAFFLMACALVGWFTVDNYERFIQHQSKLAEQSVKSAAEGVAYRMDSLRSALTLFSERENDLLSLVASQPNDHSLNQQLADIIAKHFPGYYAFTIADAEGRPQLEDPQTLISTSCRRDLANFSRDYFAPTLYVHQFQAIESLHFDLMTRLQTGRQSVPFFVSFKMDDLARTLNASAVAGHQLLLLESKPESQTSKAYAVQENGHGLKLQQTASPQSDQLLAQTQVRGSHWLVVDMASDSLLHNEAKALWAKAAALVLLFALVAISLRILLRREVQQLDRTGKVIAGVEMDRRRIAMDMHDQVLSDLSYLSRQCGFMQESVDKPQKMQEHLSASANALETVSNSIRKIIDDLHPQSLEILGLHESLSAYIARNFTDSNDLDICLKTSDYEDQRLDDETRLNLYRISLEIIHNIVRHAGASHCVIVLSMTERQLCLQIEDNGQTFRPAGKQYEHIGGLANVQTRAKMIAASISWTAPQHFKQGSCFELRLPLQA